MIIGELRPLFIQFWEFRFLVGTYVQETNNQLIQQEGWLWKFPLQLLSNLPLLFQKKKISVVYKILFKSLIITAFFPVYDLLLYY